ncbi:MAG: cytosine deaminase [Candidatus Caldarchaeales archaeon]
MIIRKARIRGKDGLFDIKIEDGLIKSISPHISARDEEEIDVEGRLVMPTFIDMHFHLDSVLTLGDPRFNKSGTLLEGIEIWSEYKKKLSVEDILDRAGRALMLMVSYGTTMIRTHADITDKNLITLKGLLEVKRLFKDIIDIQITAFPQDGILTDPENVELLEKSIEMGADNVGMIPHLEYTREDGVRSIDISFEIAKKYNKDIDGHVDETDDEHSRFLEVVAAKTIREEYFGRVTAGHATAMHSYNDAYADKLYRLLKIAQITIVPNPLINIHLQGRYDKYPKRRGLARIKELMDNGINVALGHDCIMDPWYPLGRGDMMLVLFMAVHIAQMMGYDELVRSLDLITVNSAKALRIDSKYGVGVGRMANLVVLDAYSEIEALTYLKRPLYVIKNGKIISEKKPDEVKVIDPLYGKLSRFEEPLHRKP